MPIPPQNQYLLTVYQYLIVIPGTLNTDASHGF